MAVVRELAAGEERAAATALLELRPHLGDVDSLLAVVEREMRPAGYRIVGSFDDGDPDAAAVAGFRVSRMLAWGRYMYVDDLVTRVALRGRGHAGRVFDWLIDEARREGCDQFHLDSGVQPEREDAHRFYFRHGLRISSYHFQRGL